MRKYISFLLLILSICTFSVYGQDNVPEQIENISEKVNDISQSLKSLNEQLKFFSETFSSNQGLRLTDRQQRILAAFEFLNRAEERLATLQKLKIDLTEKQTNIRLKLAEVEDSLRSESIDRSIALRGTTDAEALREIKRSALNREKIELNSLANEIEQTIYQTDLEIKDTISFLDRIRRRIFPAIEREIEEL